MRNITFAALMLVVAGCGATDSISSEIASDTLLVEASPAYFQCFQTDSSDTVISLEPNIEQDRIASATIRVNDSSKAQMVLNLGSGTVNRFSYASSEYVESNNQTVAASWGDEDSSFSLESIDGYIYRGTLTYYEDSHVEMTCLKKKATLIGPIEAAAAVVALGKSLDHSTNPYVAGINTNLVEGSHKILVIDHASEQKLSAVVSSDGLISDMPRSWD